jgi:DNA-binding transcriptional ArsR family regulator
MSRESIHAEPMRPRTTADGKPRALASEPATAPQDLTLRVLAGFRLSRAVWLAARLGITDAIADGPLTVSEIARATGAHAGSLQRLLDALAAAGLFRRERDGRFAHTAASEPLRSDHPRSQRAWLELTLGGEHLEAWGAMAAALRTGRTAFDVRHGAPWHNYYRAHPDAGRAFAEAMTATTSAFEDALLAADPFPAFELAVDVGGSRGSLLRRLLERNPGARGVLFDVPEVVDRWHDDRPVSLNGRLTAVAGDFFRAVPAGGDLYLLKFILHDWDDARAAAILRRARDAVPLGGRAAIVEMVLPDEPADHPGWLMDLNMLAITGGRERTAAEYRDLLARAGWHTDRTVPTESPLSVVPAVAT